MNRSRRFPGFVVLMLTLLVGAVRAQELQPEDLKVELRPVGGTNQFRVGEEISLEVDFSSTTRGRYLEPCAMFYTSHFGYVKCRFFNGWKFEISPADGWTDLEKEFPSSPVFSGPTFAIPSHDLTGAPVKVPLALTQFFRFDKPGVYTVRLLTVVGLDDETPDETEALGMRPKDAKFVKVRPELAIEIMPPSVEWLNGVIRKSVEAYSVELPRYTNPPTPEFLAKQAARRAFCEVGTADAARALVRLLAASRDEVTECVERTASPDAAVAELKRLMVEPETAVDTAFFAALVRLQSRTIAAEAKLPLLSSRVTDASRDALFASVSRKSGSARATSLATVLQNPPQSPPRAYEMAYTVPFDDSVIRMAAAEFNMLPQYTQDFLLKNGWDGVRSLLMLPVVRSRAESGSTDGLLRWYELDHAGAEAFARKELVRAVPRFSSHAIQLSATDVTDNEQRELAEHFILLTDWGALGRTASLLHSYATASVLPIVLPFVDAHLTEWPCSVSAPVLAYLLKVAPKEAGSRIERAMLPTARNTCGNGWILTAVATLESNEVLEQIEVRQLNARSNSEIDALEAMRRAGSAAMKPLVWRSLVREQKEILASVKSKAPEDKVLTREEQQRQQVMDSLIRTFTSAHGWLVTPEDAKHLEDVVGQERMKRVSCTFSCSSSMAVARQPANFSIYGNRPISNWPNIDGQEYLDPTGRLTYQINQYGCRTMQALKEKLLQYPTGSTFDFAWYFDERDEKEVLEITRFLQSHGFLVRDVHGWKFMAFVPYR